MISVHCLLSIVYCRAIKHFANGQLWHHHLIFVVPGPCQSGQNIVRGPPGEDLDSRHRVRVHQKNLPKPQAGINFFGTIKQNLPHPEYLLIIEQQRGL